MKIAFFSVPGLACVLALAGCGHVPPPPEPAPLDLSIIRPDVQKITADDPLPIFRKVFPRGYAATKDALETTAEYRARLAALGVAGTYVFLIPPEECRIAPYPDDGSYFILSNDYYRVGYDDKTNPTLPYGITLATIDKSSSTHDRQNRYGATVQVTTYREVKCKLWLQDFSQLPMALRWRVDHESGIHFGLPVKTADPAFRQLLREKKIGLAVRVRIDDLSQIQTTLDGYGDHTFWSSHTDSYLPATLLEAWVVDVSTLTSVVHWSAAPAGAK